MIVPVKTLNEYEQYYLIKRGICTGKDEDREVVAYPCIQRIIYESLAEALVVDELLYAGVSMPDIEASALYIRGVIPTAKRKEWYPCRKSGVCTCQE